MTTMRLGARPIDVNLFGVALRLYPRSNAYDKGVLFTPQMYGVTERHLLEQEVATVRAEGRDVVFVDVGANIGASSLFVTSLARGHARALAIEPQPVLAERLAFNIASNPGLDVRLSRVAVSERDGSVDFFSDARDLGASRIGGTGAGFETVPVRARKLLDLLVEEGFAPADILKIGIEGSEDIVLAPLLTEASDAALPRAVLIPDRRHMWGRDAFEMLERRGYRIVGRGKIEVLLRRG
jgi:FkbM family methyltransferase